MYRCIAIRCAENGFLFVSVNQFGASHPWLTALAVEKSSEMFHPIASFWALHLTNRKFLR
jgi:hypothetical protein